MSQRYLTGRGCWDRDNSNLGKGDKPFRVRGLRGEACTCSAETARKAVGAVCSKTPTMQRLSSSSSFPSLLSHEKVGVLHQKRVFFEEPLQTFFFLFSAFRCFLNENQRQLTPFQVVVAGGFQPPMCVRGTIKCLPPADIPARLATTAPQFFFLLPRSLNCTHQLLTEPKKSLWQSQPEDFYLAQRRRKSLKSGYLKKQLIPS